MESKMKKYSLSELKLANELCFPADFKKLLERHTKNTIYEDCWHSIDVSFRRSHKAGLISLIFSYSRADFDNDLGAIFNNIIDDLITKEETPNEITSTE